MRIESDGHSRGNPRLYELIEHAPKTGKSPTVWAWPELIDYLKVAGQPVAGPWPPHQQPRPDPEEESLPVAVPDPESKPLGQLESPATPGGSMYPSRFRYEAPRSLAEAIGMLHDGGDDAKVLAGGQSLVPLMKLRFAAPQLLVDINNVPGLDYHRADPDGTLRIGALCRHADLERSDLLKASQPTMASAAPLIADPIVRNRGTLVGSLCHADPQGDWASVVTALGGSVIAQGANGRRAIPVAGFVTGPFENTLEPDEIAVEAVIPPAQGTRSGGYLKLERRVGDFATVGVAVALETSGGTVRRAGIALTGVGGSTIAATAAADALAGGPLTADRIGQAAGLAAEAAQPRTDHRGSAEYKRHMVRTFVTRILNRTDAAPDAEDSAERSA